MYLHHFVATFMWIIFYFLGLTIHFPLFNGYSYVVYRPIAFTDVVNTIVMTFRTTEKNGLLVYAGHSTYKDFVQLLVIDGFLEYRFDAGAEMISLRSQQTVNSGSLHTVIAS